MIKVNKFNYSYRSICESVCEGVRNSLAARDRNNNNQIYLKLYLFVYCDIYDKKFLSVSRNELIK